MKYRGEEWLEKQRLVAVGGLIGIIVGLEVGMGEHGVSSTTTSRFLYAIVAVRQQG
jgi:hypothetical protein